MRKCSGILKDGGMSEGLEKEIGSIFTARFSAFSARQ